MQTITNCSFSHSLSWAKMVLFLVITTIFSFSIQPAQGASTACLNDSQCTPTLQYCDTGTCKNYCSTNQRCSGEKPMCFLGNCVACTIDKDCDAGMMCSKQNECVPMIRCSSNENCPADLNRICSSEGLCVLPATPCSIDAHCYSGDKCNTAKQICETPPTACTSDGDCGKNQFCETPQNICKVKFQERYVGGCAIAQYDVSNSLIRNLLVLLLSTILMVVLYQTLKIRNRKTI